MDRNKVRENRPETAAGGIPFKIPGTVVKAQCECCGVECILALGESARFITAFCPNCGDFEPMTVIR